MYGRFEVTQGALSGKVIVLGPKGKATLGRLKTNAIQIKENSVSGTHCRIRGEGQEFVLEDKPGETQWKLLPVMVGYTGSAWGTITIEIVDTYGTGAVALSELKLKAATIEDL